LTKIYRHQGGATDCVDRVDPAWLRSGSGVWVWVDLDTPTPEEGAILREVFGFHELAVEDALSETHHPKIESYGDYLYLILHGIDFSAAEHCFRTKDVDFFLGEQFLVTVHPGVSRSIGKVSGACLRDSRIMAEGPGMLMYRIIDTMVDNYRPEVDELEERLDEIETEVFEQPTPDIARRILSLKKDVASLRQVVLPQRDGVGRLARREFPLVGEQLAYRFRDVHDNLVRLVDESMFFQDRIASILDAHLSSVSNQLNSVMKVLTIMSTLFLPLTVLTGMWGMNVDLPHFAGGDRAQFWWVVAMMLALSIGMLIYFRRRGWI
jgi:magnesium transporter